MKNKRESKVKVFKVGDPVMTPDGKGKVIFKRTQYMNPDIVWNYTVQVEDMANERKYLPDEVTEILSEDDGLTL